ncbi:MAG: hypothetical protein KF897_00660 [Opitutaceae bacterium]|nr:hypothetical protein [Opitutaceae bacterium]
MAAPAAIDELVDEGEAPIGPTEAEESAYLAEQTAAAPSGATAPGGEDAAEVDEAPAKLPAIEDLVQQIPAETREALDELFRARFVRVQRIPRKVLKA